MKFWHLLVLTLIVVSAGVIWGVGGGGVAAQRSEIIPGRYIVILEPGASPDAVAAGHHLAPDHVFRSALNGFSVAFGASELQALTRDPRVNNVVPDRAMHAFPVSVGAAPIVEPLAVAAALPNSIDRVDAEGAALASPPAIAIIDTGIDFTRPELNVAGGVSFIKGNSTGQDDNGHGTHVSGTAAGRVMGTGFRGVAPGVPLYAVKVLNSSGSGSWSTVISGVDWVTNNAASKGIRVANMSLGGTGSNSANCGVSGSTVVDPLHRAICNSVQAGVVYAVAAGNSASDASGFVPAAYPEVVAVSAVGDSDGRGGHAGPATSYGADDTFATFSNFGSSVRLAAPGVDILSTVPTGNCQLCNPSGYGLLSGTSMASPHVSGALALYIALHAGVSTTGSAGTISPAALGLIAQAKPQSDFCGFTGDPGSEPFLYVGQPDTDCGALTAPTPTPAPPTATPTATSTPGGPPNTPTATPTQAPPTPSPTPTVCPPGKVKQGRCV